MAERTPVEALKSTIGADEADAELRRSVRDFVHLVMEVRREAPAHLQLWMFVVGMGDPMLDRLRNARLALIEIQKITKRDAGT